MVDPLAGRAAPNIQGCGLSPRIIFDGVTTLNPGVYCGGLFITGTAKVIFNPGTYVIKYGPLSVSGNASISGKDMAIYLTGPNATLDFIGNATIDLSGAETGDLAGLLIYADRNQPSGTTHNISAANVKQLTGTIYMPSSDLRIDPNSKVASQSAYTAIIVSGIRVLQGSNLVMNTDYNATKVPVPEGVRSGATVVLTN